MPIYKRCSRCSKRIPEGTTCKCQKQRYKEYDKHYRDSKSKEFYGSRLWNAAREEVLALDEGIDVYLYMETGEIVAADTVHHIIPLRDDWGRRLDVNNLMSLSHDTHSMIEQRYKTEKEEIMLKLFKMLREYRSRKGAGGN